MDDKKVKRSTENGVELSTTYRAGDGTSYEVPLYRCLPGTSLDAGAKAIGRKIPGRRERSFAEEQRKVIASIHEGADVYPVVTA